MLRKDFVLRQTRNSLNEFLAPITAKADKLRQKFLRQAVGAILLFGYLVVTELAHWIHDDCSDIFHRLKRLLNRLTLEGHPYVFVSPKRLGRIKERRKISKWNPRSELINNLSRDFNIIRRKAKLEDFTLHDLRRSAITNWAQKLPIQVVQQLAGHASITTTRKYYLAVRTEDLQSASKWLNKILAGRNSD